MTATTKKVLIVDDSPFFIKALDDLLAAEGFLVSTASSGKEAMARLDAMNMSGGSFDLLITDLVMPGESGYDLARFVKEKNRMNRFLPVIMLTEQVISKDEARKHGCAAYIPKSNLGKVLSMSRILLTRFE